MIAQFAGWPTPTRLDSTDTRNSTANRSPDAKPFQIGNTLVDAASFAGWATPRAEDAESSGMRHSRGVADTLTAQTRLTGPARLTDTGELRTGSSAQMASGGQLSPAHSRWLMGLPPVWDACAVTAMPSFSRKPRRSSKRTSSSSEG
jgi:hypothetical protein